MTKNMTIRQAIFTMQNSVKVDFDYFSRFE